MKNKPIIRSPFAIDPFETMFMTEEEKNNLYSKGFCQWAYEGLADRSNKKSIDS